MAKSVWVAVLMLAMCAAVAGAQDFAKDAARDLPALLPRKRVEARLMEMTLSKRCVEIGETMEAAIAANPEWWQEFIGKAEPGKPLPYDKNLGVTEAEYAEYLKLCETPELAQTDTLDFRAIELEENVFVLSVRTERSLSGLIVDLTRNQATGKTGICADTFRVDVKDGPLGAWSGYQWGRESENPPSYEKIALGKAAESGDSIFYYKMGVMRDGGASRQDFLLMFQPDKDPFDEELYAESHMFAADMTVKQAPEDHDARIVAAFMYFSNASFQKAEEHYLKASQLAPDDAYDQMWLYLARARADKNAGAEALRTFLNSHRNEEFVYKNMEMLLGDITPEECIKAAVASEEKEGNLCEAHYYAAQVCLIRGDKEGAAAHLRASIRTGMFNYWEFIGALDELDRLTE